MTTQVEISTGIDSYEESTLIKDAHYDDFNLIADQYDVGERWVEMQERATSALDENIHTIGDWDEKCAEIAEEINAE